MMASGIEDLETLTITLLQLKVSTTKRGRVLSGCMRSIRENLLGYLRSQELHNKLKKKLKVGGHHPNCNLDKEVADLRLEEAEGRGAWFQGSSIVFGASLERVIEDDTSYDDSATIANPLQRDVDSTSESTATINGNSTVFIVQAISSLLREAENRRCKVSLQANRQDVTGNLI